MLQLLAHREQPDGSIYGRPGMTTTGPIEFQVLGPTEARRDGAPILLSGARRRALIARLLLDADRVVPADTLMADVWEGKASPAATATLQTHISQPRKVLGVCLQTRRAGYALCLDSAVMDSVEFERQAAGSTRSHRTTVTEHDRNQPCLPASHRG